MRTHEEEKQWQAFDSTDGKGTWWWNRNNEDWFLESEPGNWTQFTDTENGQPHWCHPDGRCFCASLDPWLIEQYNDNDEIEVHAGATERVPERAATSQADLRPTIPARAGQSP